uniref:DNA topoisomerase 2 n=1 Tax=Bursaphelenchus xylophilus TaxID=6326 RepID=A0A1I7SHR6_BURXY
MLYHFEKSWNSYKCTVQSQIYIPRRFQHDEEFGEEIVDEKDVFQPVEQQFQRKTQLEHILLRPDTYIGSVEFCDRTPMWIYDASEKRLIHQPISFVPGLYKIFDEILVNAADNRRRDKRMSKIEVQIDRQENRISIMNNGRGIPVVWHKQEKMYVPELIFGTLLTSSNYNDSDRKTTGGRNGFGAKLCNIFSKEFTLETSYIQNGKSFKQTWTDNMTSTSEPQIDVAKSEDFTKVTFTPDLQKFGMKSLDHEIIGLMSRRALDISATTRGVKVFLNGELLPVNNFPDYMDLFSTEGPTKTKFIFDQNRRWQIGVGVSNKGFQQMSFVNSVWTLRGGRHVDFVVDQIVDCLMTEIHPRLRKQGIQLKAHQIKNNLFVFVNSLIENPAFDSQTKETLTTKPKLFGSEWKPTSGFIKKLLSAGIVEASATLAKQKQLEKYEKANTYVRTPQIEVPKLVDANEAGTSKSSKCTLILTEGDSAKSLAIAGLSVIGQDKYGVFPLK